MGFSFSDLLDFSKIPIKIFLLFAIVSGLLLFGSDEFLLQLKLTEFEQDYGKFFGIIFITCVAFIVLSIVYYIFNKINYYFLSRKMNKYLRDEIKCLDSFEQAAIREFFVQEKKTVLLNLNKKISDKEIKKIVKDAGYNVSNITWKK